MAGVPLNPIVRQTGVITDAVERLGDPTDLPPVTGLLVRDDLLAAAETLRATAGRIDPKPGRRLMADARKLHASYDGTGPKVSRDIEIATLRALADGGCSLRAIGGLVGIPNASTVREKLKA